MGNICVHKATITSDYCGGNIKDLINEPCNRTYKISRSTK